MMRTKWIAFITGCMLLGCANENMVNVSDDALVPLVVSAPSLLDVESTPIVSKSATVVTSGSLGVFLVANSGANYAARNNVRYNHELNNPKWVCSTVNSIFLNSSEATMYGYYPYDELVTGSAALGLTSQLNTGTDIDLCYTKSAVTASKAAPTASFAMSHAYSKLTINFKNLYYKEGIGKIDNISIVNASIIKKASLNLFTGAITPTEMSTLVAPFSFNPAIASIPAYDAANAATVISTSVLLIPADPLTGGSVVLSLMLDGLVKSTTSITMPEAKLVAGKNYVIDVTINYRGEATVSGVAKYENWVMADGLLAVRPHR